MRHWDLGAFMMRPWMQHRPRLLRCVTRCPRAASATIIWRTWTNIFIQKQSQIIFIQCGCIDPNIKSNHLYSLWYFIMAISCILFLIFTHIGPVVETVHLCRSVFNVIFNITGVKSLSFTYYFILLYNCVALVGMSGMEPHFLVFQSLVWRVGESHTF